MRAQAVALNAFAELTSAADDADASNTTAAATAAAATAFTDISASLLDWEALSGTDYDLDVAFAALASVASGAVPKLHSRCVFFARGARVFLNISAKFWRISRPDRREPRRSLRF